MHHRWGKKGLPKTHRLWGKKLKRPMPNGGSVWVESGITSCGGNILKRLIPDPTSMRKEKGYMSAQVVATLFFSPKTNIANPGADGLYSNRPPGLKMSYTKKIGASASKDMRCYVAAASLI